MAITFRESAGTSDVDRRAALERLHRDIDRTAAELDVRWVSVVSADLPAEVDLLRPS